LYVLKSDQPGVRVGVSAGLAVGNAVKRNRAKRLLREAMNGLFGQTTHGSDLLLIARSPLPNADLLQTRAALTNLLKRAGLLTQTHDA
jgi:ribonuclease P protein component